MIICKEIEKRNNDIINNYYYYKYEISEIFLAIRISYRRKEPCLFHSLHRCKSGCQVRGDWICPNHMRRAQEGVATLLVIERGRGSRGTRRLLPFPFHSIPEPGAMQAFHSCFRGVRCNSAVYARETIWTESSIRLWVDTVSAGFWLFFD